MERRTFLAGGAAAAVGLTSQPAAAQYFDKAWLEIAFGAAPCS